MDAINILDMPPELLGLILQRIKWKEVIRCETICKKVCRAARQTITKLNYNGIDAKSLENIIAKYGATLLDLSVKMMPSNDDESTNFFRNKLARLTSLRILSWIDPHLVPFIQLPNLLRLKINNRANKWEEFFDEIASLTKLTRLSVDRMDRTAVEILTKLSNLGSLQVDNRRGDFQNWSYLRLLTTVKRLVMRGCSGSFTCQMSQLTSLKIEAESAFKLREISNLAQLQRFTFDGPDLTEDFGVFTRLTQLQASFALGGYELLTKFQQLKRITIPLVVEGDLVQYLSKLPNLESIIAYGVKMSLDFDELTACSNLTRLHISCEDRLNILPQEAASSLQQQMYERIAKLTTLKELEIDYFDNIEPLLVLTNLQYLRIFANYRKTPIEELAPIKRLPNLSKFFFDTLDAIHPAKEIKDTLFSPESLVKVVGVAQYY